jgi:cold shock CspA family protein
MEGPASNPGLQLMDAAMPENNVRAGLITRVVRVALTNNDDSHRCGCHGYGIIQGIEGRDVFFVDSALQNTSFSELESGQQVLYIMEAGPFGRASRVWLTTPPTQVHDQQNLARQTRAKQL